MRTFGGVSDELSFTSLLPECAVRRECECVAVVQRASDVSLACLRPWSAALFTGMGRGFQGFFFSAERKRAFFGVSHMWRSRSSKPEKIYYNFFYQFHSIWRRKNVRVTRLNHPSAKLKRNTVPVAAAVDSFAAPASAARLNEACSCWLRRDAPSSAPSLVSLVSSAASPKLNLKVLVAAARPGTVGTAGACETGPKLPTPSCATPYFR